MKKLQPVAKLNINSIFFQLDRIAKENADTSDIQVVNLGVDEEKGIFIGPGNMLLIACAKEENNVDDDLEKFKTQCYNVLKTYIKFFVGDDTSKRLKKDDLQPIRKRILEKRKKDDSKKDESIDWRKSILHILVEDSVFKEDSSNKQQVVGYSIQYDMQLEGQKEVDLAQSAKNIGKHIGGFIGGVVSGFVNGTSTVGKDILKTMFGNVASDIASIRFNTFGSNSIGVKDLVDPAMKISKSIAGLFKSKVAPFLKNDFLSKDIDEVASKLQTRLNDKYPGTTAEVRTQKKNVIIAKLKKKGKFSDEVKKVLSNQSIDNCITVEVDSKDKNYPLFSVKSIASNLAWIVGSIIGKIAKIDDEKQKAEVVNFLSKNYSIVKVQDYEGNSSQVKRFESVDLTRFIDLMFESDCRTYAEKLLLEVSKEFNDTYIKIQNTLTDKDGSISKIKIDKFADALMAANENNTLNRKELYPSKDDKRGVSNFVSKLKRATDKKQLGDAFSEIDGKDVLEKLLKIAQDANPSSNSTISINSKKDAAVDLYIISKPTAWNKASSNKDDKSK